MCADGMDRSGLPITDNDAVRETSKQLQRSARLARWFGLGLIFIGVIAMLLTSVATVYMGSQVRTLVRQAVAEQERLVEERKREAELIGTIMSCILGQFAEHRAASREYQDRSARHHGFLAPTTAAPESPPDHAKVKAACDKTVQALGGG